MRYLSVLLLVVLANANEFKFIQPISVEEAPVQKMVEKKVSKEKKIKETKIKESKQTVKKVDSDNDGIIDEKDKCPNTSKDFIVDYQGCPKTATLKINFAPAKYDVSEDLIDNLKEFAHFLQQNKSYQVVIYGYTDSIGSVEENKILSQKRSEAVKKALESYGISSTRLTAVGMGERDPIADNMYKDGRAKSRRIEVELIY